MKNNIYERHIILRNSKSKKASNELKLNSEAIIKFIPLISIFLLICGATNIFFYYSHFGFDIFLFIENFEIISLNFQFVIILIIKTILLIPIIYLLINGISKILMKITKIKSSDFHKKDFLELYLWFNISITVLIIYEYYSLSFEEFIHVFKINLLVILYSAVVYIVLEKTKDYKSIIIKILFPILIFGFSILNGMDDAIQNKNADNYIVDFNYNNTYITSNKNIKLIGKTNKYLFMYSSSQKETLIYETDKISNLRIIIKDK